jgi:adenylylsulfate kinase
MNAIVLDGDDVRSNLNKDLGFSKEDRIENLRRFGAMADIINRQGFDVIICTVAPHVDCRDIVKSNVSNYTSVYIDTPLELCKERDVKGMYRKAIAGDMDHFTGVHNFIDIGTPDVVVTLDDLTNQVSFILSSL